MFPETYDIGGGWLNAFPPHLHLRVWKPWCSYLEIWTFGEGEPTRLSKRHWSRKGAQRATDEVLAVVVAG